MAVWAPPDNCVGQLVSIVKIMLKIPVLWCHLVSIVTVIQNTCPVVLCSAIGEGAGGIGGGAGIVDITGGT